MKLYFTAFLNYQHFCNKLNWLLLSKVSNSRALNIQCIQTPNNIFTHMREMWRKNSDRNEDVSQQWNVIIRLFNCLKLEALKQKMNLWKFHHLNCYKYLFYPFLLTKQGNKIGEHIFTILLNKAITWVIFQKTHHLGKNFM